MKLAVDAPQATLSNVGTTGTFKIKNSAKAFSILSSGLYSNKIKAIVRELSCNAVDSHKEAGKEDEPFHVHLPNSLEPFFSVRDYGIGLDHDGVTQLYTTYFESTKQDSNDYIGALGLGSKSPFSYTDNFTVTAIKDGVQRIYTAYIEGETGCPAIAQMGESETAEGNGVEVKFSVNQGDFHAFVREAGNVFKWFKSVPKITGVANFEIPTVSYAEKNISEGVHLSASNGRPVAIQGNIAYPLSGVDATDWPAEVRALLDCPLIVEFEIGELDIAASREELSYVSWTNENILKRLTIVAADVAKYVEEQVKDIECEWELAFRLRELYRENLFKSGAIKLVGAGRSKLLKLDSGNSVRVDNSKLEFKPEYFNERKLKFRRFVVESNWSGTVTKEQKTSTRYNQTNSIHEHFYEVPFGKNTLWIINDTKKGVLSRLKSHFKNGAATTRGSIDVILLDVEKEEYENRDKIYNAFFDELMNPPGERMNASDLQETDRLKSVKTSLLESEARQYRGRSYDPHVGWSKVSPKIEFDPKETYYYVPVSNYTVLNADGTENSDFLEVTWRDMVRANLQPANRIYGVRKSYIETVKAEKNWVCVYDVLESAVKSFDIKKVEQYIIRNLVDTDVVNSYTCKYAEGLGKSSLFRTTMEKYAAAISLKDDGDVISAAKRLLSKYGQSIDFNKQEKELKKEYSDLISTYPMLNYFSGRYDSKQAAKAIIEYVQLIDNTRSTK
jgi:hypothetical protein